MQARSQTPYVGGGVQIYFEKEKNRPGGRKIRLPIGPPKMISANI